jgi:RimJ/RimL family protein N-acetyltransferase
MPRLLTKTSFSEADLALPQVQAFFCGEERWEREITEWLRSPAGENSALQDMKNHGTEIWLHWIEESEPAEGSSGGTDRVEAGTEKRKRLVGVSSLGQTQWRWPPPKGPKRLLNIIPCVGLQKAFQGEPKDAPAGERFASQILDHLIYEATTRTHREPRIVLMVDEENLRAIRFYEKAGFARLPQPHVSRGVRYLRMAMDISQFLRQGQTPSTGQVCGG